MGKLLIFLIAIAVSEVTYADRYGVGDDFSSGGGSNFITMLLGLACVVIAYGKLFSMYMNPRSDNPEDIEREKEDWFFNLIGYAILSFFLIPPVLFVIKFILSAAVVKSIFFPLWIIVTLLIKYTRP